MKKLIIPLLLIIFGTYIFPSDIIHFRMKKNGENSFIPIVSARTDDMIYLNLMFDTASMLEPTLHYSGLLKCDYTVKKDQSYTVNFKGITFGKTRIENINFIYDPEINKGFSTKHIDGYFNPACIPSVKRVTINYINNTIEINGEKLVNNIITMKKGVVLTNAYMITIIINGVEQTGIIDTGNNMLVVSNNSLINKSNLTTEEEVDYINNGLISKTTAKDISISTLQIGNKCFNDVTAYYGTDERFKTSPKTMRILSLYTSIGYPIFKDHIIQLDFESNEFSIE